MEVANIQSRINVYAFVLDFIYRSAPPLFRMRSSLSTCTGNNFFAVDKVNPKMPVLLQLMWELPDVNETVSAVSRL